MKVVHCRVFIRHERLREALPRGSDGNAHKTLQTFPTEVEQTNPKLLWNQKRLAKAILSKKRIKLQVSLYWISEEHKLYSRNQHSESEQRRREHTMENGQCGPSEPAQRAKFSAQRRFITLEGWNAGDRGMG